MKGLEEIAKLIRRFSEVENLYLRRVNHRLAEDLEDELLIMYRKVLEFEARAACQFDRNTASQAIRNIVKADGWSDLLNDIKESETRCNILTQIMDAENRHKWNDLIETMISEQTAKVNELLLISKSHNDEEPRHGLSRANTFRGEEPSSANRKEEAECITLFRTTDYENDKNKNPSRVPGTCEWVLKHPVFRKWDQEDSIGWLWITANPGCGKSVLARFLTEDFYENKEGTYICYFFFKDDTETNRSANHALCAILHQLMCYDARMVRHALSAYASNGKQLPHLIESLWKVFIATIEALDRPLLCVFDALDECQESSRLDLLAKLAPLFGKGSHPNKLKIVMTSRPNTPTGDAIWRHGVDPMSIQLTGEREVESQAISSEIDLYVTEKIRGFKDLRRHRQIHDDAHEILKQKISSIENRTYLWVALIFPELEKNAGLSKTRLSSIIDQIPTTVQEAYEKILSRSLDRQRARNLLHLVVAALRPLTLIEMNVALAIERWSDQESELDLDPEETFELTIRELCGLFVTVKKGQIYLIHQTAREFLIRDKDHARKDALEPTAWNWRHSLLPIESHRLAAHTCMLYLLLYSIHNDQRATHKASEGVSLDEIAAEKPWRALFDYAATYWSAHSISMNFTSENLNEPFDTTTSTAGNELTWLEMYEIGPRWLPSAAYASSALSMASHAGLYPVVRELLLTQSAADDGIKPLKYAICNHRTATIEILLDNIADKAENEVLLNAAVHIACHVNEERAVQRLLDFNVVKPAQPDSLGRTAMIWALRGESTGSFMHLSNYFMSKGLPLWSGTTLSACLQVAANNNRVAEIQELLRQTETLSSDERLAALRQAIIEDHESAVIMLAVTPDDRLTCPQKVIEIAIRMALEYNKANSAEFLLQALTNFEARNSDGETPLLIATRNENVNLAHALIQYGADINAVASEGWNRCREGVGQTPLYCATSHKDVAIFSLLLQKEAKTDVRCHGGDTALHQAVALSSVNKIQLLLDAGADPTIANQYGLTVDQAASRASEYMKKEDQSEIVAMLTEAACLRSSERPAKCPGQSSSIRTLGTCPPKPELFHPLLSQMKDSLDVETFSQILEMDDDDEPYDYHQFSRSIVSGYFTQNRENVFSRCEIAM